MTSEELNELDRMNALIAKSEASLDEVRRHQLLLFRYARPLIDAAKSRRPLVVVKYDRAMTPPAECEALMDSMANLGRDCIAIPQSMSVEELPPEQFELLEWRRNTHEIPASDDGKSFLVRDELGVRMVRWLNMGDRFGFFENDGGALREVIATHYAVSKGPAL